MCKLQVQHLLALIFSLSTSLLTLHFSGLLKVNVQWADMQDWLVEEAEIEESNTSGSSSRARSTLEAWDHLQSNSSQSPTYVLELFGEANKKLVQEVGAEKFVGASMCGFYVDCPRWYTVSDVERSITVTDNHADLLQKHVDKALRNAHQKAKEACLTRRILQSGGWCLCAESGSKILMGSPPNQAGKMVSFPLSKHHVPKTSCTGLEDHRT